MIYGYDPLEDPPTTIIGSNADYFEALWAPGVMVLNWDGVITDETFDQLAEVYMARHASPGRKLTLHNAKRYDLALFSAYTLLYLDPEPDTYTFWLRACEASGQVGPWLTARVTVPEP
jgi:hypothetical protein